MDPRDIKRLAERLTKEKILFCPPSLVKPFVDDATPAGGAEGKPTYEAVESLLSGSNDPIITATAVLSTLNLRIGQLSVTDLRRLSFLRDRGRVSFVSIRKVAREELMKRGAWTMTDRIRALFSLG